MTTDRTMGWLADSILPSRLLRVALIAPPWFPVPPSGYGGIERVVYLLANGLVERGHDVTVLGRSGAGLKARVIDLLGKDWSCHLGAQDQAWWHLLYLTRVHEFLRETSYDIVHDHNESMGVAFGAMCCGRSSFLATLHGTIGSHLRSLLAVVDHRVGLVGISSAQRSQAEEIRWLGTVTTRWRLSWQGWQEGLRRIT